MLFWNLNHLSRALGSSFNFYPLSPPKRKVSIKNLTASEQNLDEQENVEYTEDIFIKRISTDTRELEKEDLFLALRGDCYDGHDYLAQAIKRGASILIFEKKYIKDENIKKQLITAIKNSKVNLAFFLVENSLLALQKLAKYYRRKIKGHCVAITGSNGKTSTRAILQSLVSFLVTKERVSATKGNLNNHIGVPLSILSVAPEKLSLSNFYLILELGMNHKGEIELLSKIARPDFAIITSIAEAHVGNFAGVEEIVEAKLEILLGMQKGATLLFNKESHAYGRAAKRAKSKKIHLLPFGGEDTQVKATRDGLSFTWKKEKFNLKSLFHPVFAENMLSCLELLYSLGYSPSQLRNASSVLEKDEALRNSLAGRFELHQKKRRGRKEQLFVDDSYNANPSSFQKAIENLRLLVPDGYLLLIAGEMAELGKFAENAHRKLAILCAELDYSCFIAIGAKYSLLMKDIFLKTMLKNPPKKGKALVSAHAFDNIHAAKNILSAEKIGFFMMEYL